MRVKSQTMGFHPLMWPDKAMVIPAKAGIQMWDSAENCQNHLEVVLVPRGHSLAFHQAETVVEAYSLTFSYGTLQVLNGLSFSVREGEVFGVLGANGSGKTTLMRMMVGLLRNDGGTLTIYGESPSPRQAAQVGYMPQLSALYQELSIRENVDFFARMYGMSDRRSRGRSVEEAIDLVGLAPRSADQILNLSGGMRQRVSLAIALVHRPALLILDEPTVGLDPDVRAVFWQRFRRMADSGTTIMISSHTMDDAAHCDRLAFLRDGRVIALDTPSALRAATGRPDASLEDAFIHFLHRSND